MDNVKDVVETTEEQKEDAKKAEPKKSGAKKAEPKKYKVQTPVENYCGVGDGGVQFANGEATVCEGSVLEWYREHGYTVTEK